MKKRTNTSLLIFLELCAFYLFPPLPLIFVDVRISSNFCSYGPVQSNAPCHSLHSKSEAVPIFDFISFICNFPLVLFQIDWLKYHNCKTVEGSVTRMLDAIMTKELQMASNRTGRNGKLKVKDLEFYIKSKFNNTPMSE